MKTCSRCRESKPLEDFHVTRRYKDGRAYVCKACTSALQQTPEFKAKQAQYWEKNRERLNAASRERYWARWEKVQARHKDYFERNRERMLAYYREYRDQHKDQYRTYRREWRARNPLIGRLESVRRRVLLNNLDARGTITVEQLRARIEFYGWRCYLCGCDLSAATLNIDHRIPLSRGGSNWPANIAPACRRCNASKGTRTEREFRHDRAMAAQLKGPRRRAVPHLPR